MTGSDQFHIYHRTTDHT